MQNQPDLWVVKPVDESNEQREQASHPLYSSRWWNMVLRNYKLVGLLVLVALFIVAGLWFGRTPPGHAGTTPLSSRSKASTKVNSTSSENLLITVDVHGDVVHPGLVKVAPDARVADVVQASGGFVHNGDSALINQAALVFDGEEIDVPTVPQRSSASLTKRSAATPTSATTASISKSIAPDANAISVAQTSRYSARIDLNTADAATLETLPDVGTKRASEVIQYRQTHGPFTSVNDLLNIRGIGTKTLEKWAPSLYVDKSASTAKSP